MVCRRPRPTCHRAAAACVRPAALQVGVNPMEQKVLLITKGANDNVTMAGRNIAKLSLNTASSIGILDVLHADRIVIEQDALAHVQATFGPSA